ncbi:CDP-glycerol glycerophosphotransferase family protein [Lysinibacter sp. HNR]|uniref:CDP-glycerol glycerophosphotransferase family protein n=1 Tax=Lysinibacter sp. HNR TaxID=3031408 RepID=UPI0024351D95|nr:CDP-glycerol glycerophosphotransferase family protein [Lysinibacter sp. HNR]WGD38600.1 CDP-glycerol glycerophosphotransferase family protein [Lysinibacter sp. HNR]
MNIVNDLRRTIELVQRVIKRRRDRRETLELLRDRGAPPPQHFKIVVYFADDRVNLYQMRQWYRPLAVLAEQWPVMIIARSAGGARMIIEETSLTVAFAPQVSDLEQIVKDQDIRIVLYVNQNTRNFQMMRYGRMWHVFINHGESDKMYMTTNQFKAYDYSLIAGSAARARLERVLWNYDFDTRAIPIGRPQIDHYDGEVPYPSDGRVSVLYAPTWEGDRPAATYGSIVSHGVELATQILESDRHRLIYRPHPRSGVVSVEYREAHAKIVSLIEEANRIRPDSHHVYDQSAQIGWQLSRTDVVITDISAMIYDRLAVGKPIFVTRPVSAEAVVDSEGYLSQCEWLEASEAPQVIYRVDKLLNDLDAQERLLWWSERYFGDITPGASTRRFHAAIERILDDWQSWNDRS